MMSGREGGRTRVKCILHQGAYELVGSREYVEEIMHKDSSKVLFAIIDKTSPSYSAFIFFVCRLDAF